MVESLVILVIGLIPAVFSLLLVRKAEAQAQAQLRSAMTHSASRHFYQFPTSFSLEHRYVEGIGYLVGDITCCFNARSAYLRCAVNPSGPCQDCLHYQPIEFKDSKA